MGKDRRKCENLKGGGGDARFCWRHIKLQFSCHFVRGWFHQMVQLFSIQRLFHSWYKWAYRAPCHLESVLKAPEGGCERIKIHLPPHYASHLGFFCPEIIVHHRIPSMPASKCVSEDGLRTNNPKDTI